MKTKKTAGSALILTTILLFVILGMVVSLTYVTVMEQKMSGKTKSSVGSFYNAESGVEWVLNKIASTSESKIADTFTSLNTDGSVNCPDSFGEDSCKVYLLDKDGNVLDPATDFIADIKAVRSVGANQNETQRAIEAAVADTGDVGKYQFMCFGSTNNKCIKMDTETGDILECKSTDDFVNGPWAACTVLPW